MTTVISTWVIPFSIPYSLVTYTSISVYTRQTELSRVPLQVLSYWSKFSLTKPIGTSSISIVKVHLVLSQTFPFLLSLLDLVFILQLCKLFIRALVWSLRSGSLLRAFPINASLVDKQTRGLYSQVDTELISTHLDNPDRVFIKLYSLYGYSSNPSLVTSLPITEYGFCSPLELCCKQLLAFSQALFFLLLSTDCRFRHHVFIDPAGHRDLRS